jgi:hypothetical protein
MTDIMSDVDENIELVAKISRLHFNASTELFPNNIC